MRTTVGQLMLNEALPEELRDYDRVYDKKSIKTVLRVVAEKYPEQYRDVAQKLMQLGGEVATIYGGEASVSLDSLRAGEQTQKLRDGLRKNVQAILATPRLSHEQRDGLIVKAVGRAADEIRTVNFAEQLAKRNALAMQVNSGARGNPIQFSQTNVGDLLVSDNRDNPVPVALLHSYAEGLDPVEYWAGAYGARKGTIAAKMCLSADTPVRMADGSTKRISDICVNDMVLGASDDGTARPVRVLNVFNNGDRHCYRYIFRKNARRDNYVSLTATEDHEVLSEWRSANSWDNNTTPMLRPLRAIRLYDRAYKNQFVATLASGAELVNTIDEPRAWLAGLLIGDGCTALSAHGNVLLSCADRLLLRDIAEPLSKLGCAFKLSSRPYAYLLTELAARANKHSVRHPLRQWLDDIGLRGKLAHEKTLPAVIHTWNNAAIAGLIGGIFSADGSVYLRNNGLISLALSMTALPIITTVHDLLEQRFGIYPTTISAQTPGQRRKHQLYSWIIAYDTCVRRFANNIPLLGIKRRVLATALTTTPRSAHHPGCRVVAREDFGMQPTFDLEVDHPSHMFVLANGLIVANSTPKGGYLAKQLGLATHRVVVTEDDCETTNGIPVDADDADNVGALLARDYGNMTANSIITPQMTKQLARHKTVVVRSPMTCEAKGGVCAKCAGVREKGKLPEIGDNVGLAAAAAISEPVTQSALSTKHTGGVVGAGQSAAGFDAINSLVQVPKTFQGAAAISKVDGRVTAIENAPQGGKFVVVAGERHYVPPGFELSVKPGDVVEAGDVMSDGLPNPAEIVRYKGIGAGRWHFMNNFRNTLKASKIGANRRNIELLSRGLINHVFVTGNEGPRDTLPGDTVEFNTLTKGYTARPGSKTYTPKHAIGRYLEAPALQYSLGTHVTPRIARELAQHGVNNVTAHDDAPPYVPEMVRAMDTLSYSPDWLVRLGGFHLKKNLLEAVHRGRGAKEHSESYIPALAKGVEFGKPPTGSGAVY